MKALQIPLNALSAGISPVPRRVHETAALAPEGSRAGCWSRVAGAARTRRVSSGPAAQWRDGQPWLQARLAQSDIPRREQTFASACSRLPAVAFDAHKLDLWSAVFSADHYHHRHCPFAVQTVISGQTPTLSWQDGTSCCW